MTAVPPHEWRPFLERFSRDLLEEPEIRDELPTEAVASGWLGYPPASPKEIEQVEQRLGIILPPSYRSFLQVTNGWRGTGYFIRHLWPVGDVDRHINRHRDLVDAWIEGEAALGPTAPILDADYFVYGPQQQPYTMRPEYLADALEISPVDDGVYLLNPRIVTPEGEWEAWFFADWLAGAERFQSFWDLMHGAHESYLRMRIDRE